MQTWATSQPRDQRRRRRSVFWQWELRLNLKFAVTRHGGPKRSLERWPLGATAMCSRVIVSPGTRARALRCAIDSILRSLGTACFVGQLPLSAGEPNSGALVEGAQGQARTRACVCFCRYRVAMSVSVSVEGSPGKFAGAARRDAARCTIWVQAPQYRTAHLYRISP